MEVNSATQSNYVNNVENKKENTTTIDNSVFDSLINKDIAPKEITYNEYKNLTKEDINKLFPKDTMSEQNTKAISLFTRATGSEDEILNQVLFEKELESDGSKFTKRTSRMIDSFMNIWESMEQMKIASEKTEQYMKDNNINFSKEELLTTGIEFYSKIHSAMYKETVVPENQKKISASEMFEIFDNNKMGGEETIRRNKYTSHDEYYNYHYAMVEYENSIRDAYQKKVDENNAVLASYTQNNKSNPVENQESTSKVEDKKEEKQTNKIEDNNEVNSTTTEDLVADLLSLIRTGLTESELKYLQELLAEIKQLVKDEIKNKRGISAEKEIAEKLKELETAIMKLQKRLTGEAVIEAGDSKSTKKFESTTPVMQDFESRIDVAQKAIQKLKEGKLNEDDTSYTDDVSKRKE